jgi:hypothetical protein
VAFGALNAPNVAFGALNATNVAFGALNATNVAFGALNATNAALGRIGRGSTVRAAAATSPLRDRLHGKQWLNPTRHLG